VTLACDLKSSSSIYTQKFHIINGDIYERKVVHRFVMSYSDDPLIVVAEPIYKWQQTEKGKWVMKHGIDQVFHCQSEPMTYNQNVIITAMITPKRWTEFCLRFVDNDTV